METLVAVRATSPLSRRRVFLTRSVQFTTFLLIFWFRKARYTSASPRSFYSRPTGDINALAGREPVLIITCSLSCLGRTGKEDYYKVTDEGDNNVGWVFKTSIYEHRLHVNSQYKHLFFHWPLFCVIILFFSFMHLICLVISETPFNFLMNDTRFTTLSWFQTVFLTLASIILLLYQWSGKHSFIFWSASHQIQILLNRYLKTPFKYFLPWFFYILFKLSCFIWLT